MMLGYPFYEDDIMGSPDAVLIDGALISYRKRAAAARRKKLEAQSPK